MNGLTPSKIRKGRAIVNRRKRLVQDLCGKGVLLPNERGGVDALLGLKARFESR